MQITDLKTLGGKLAQLSDDEAAQAVRALILAQSARAHVGHIGSALSIADLVAALYRDLLKVPETDAPERERFVLSKGHAALALYATLYLKGWLTYEELDTYCQNGSDLGVHPEYTIKGIDFSSGSLGQGVGMAAGAALAARLQGSTRRTFVLLSDAECNEGSVWEAVAFAAHHRLANLIAIVDNNRQQALGYTREVMDFSPLTQRWQAFGWDAVEINGHDMTNMARLVENLNTTEGAPHVLIANTVFGKGVSYMSSQIKWHYLPMTEPQYEQAMQEIGVEA